MKKIVSKLLIVLIAAQLFVPLTFGVGRTKNNVAISVAQAEEECVISEESFSHPDPLPTTTNSTKPDKVIYNVKSTGCLNKLVELTVHAYPGLSVVSDPFRSRITNDNFSFELKPGELACEGGDCNEIRMKLRILDDRGYEIFVKEKSTQFIAFKCSESSCNEEKWELVSTVGTTVLQADDCKITNVVFNPQTKKPDTRPSAVNLVIGTDKCQNLLISDLQIKANGVIPSSVLEVPQALITSNSIFYEIIPGEESCSGSACDDIIVDFYIMNSSSGERLIHYISSRTDGADGMSFKCTGGVDGKCNDKLEWDLKGSTGVTQNTSSGLTVYYYQITSKDGSITNSPDFTTEEVCNTARDAQVKKEQSLNTGATVSSCSSKVIQQTTNGTPVDNGELPECSIIFPVKIGGCIAQGIYYLFFKTSSFLFGLTGKILDFSIMYSIDSTSYQSSFVVEGWGVVRDFCNMFFIFILLYIAFGTILGIHSVKTKEMIINVILIGLLINFSLFATQLIIDASNILTRVFYNQNTIVTGTQTNSSGGVISQLGEFGEIKLSEAIVTKVDPQKLILQAEKVDSIPVRGAVTDEDQETTSKGITVGTFILVTLLATVVNVVGMIAFMSSALIFIARVIGLWLSMILAPLAFFSYIVPAMQGWGVVGWKNWWPETLKLAFLGPVFVFFMYLIVGFMDKGLGVIDAVTGGVDRSNLGFVVSIIVPFIFICILLMKAKDIAKDMSGKIGQSITGAVASVGGMALGGAALGVAAIGRNTIGAFMKGASTGNTAAQRLRDNDPTLNSFGRFKGRLQQATGVDWLQRRVGTNLNANQHDIEHAAHARHDLDEAANVVAHGKKWDELNGEQRNAARRNLERTNQMRINGMGRRTWAQLNDTERATIDALVDPSLAARNSRGDQLIQDARRKVGLAEGLVQSTVGGSFDLRNLSKLVAGEQDTGINKFATMTTSMLASGIRGAFKEANINYGTGQKNFLKDLGHTITESLKSASVKIDLSSVGEEKKEGHDGHGGGGHH